MNSFAEKQKQLKEQAVKETIYLATLEVISRQPGDSLKMQDIAETAGIATGTLYNYFKNKVELLTFVNQRLHTVILNKIQEVTRTPRTPEEKLSSVVREIFAIFKTHHIVFDLAEKFGTKTKMPKAAKREGLNQAKACIEKILTEGIEKQKFRKVDPALAAAHFFSAIIGALEIQSWMQEYEMDKEAKTLTDFFLSYLAIRS